MLTINMKSSADKVKGQGVGSAYLEMVELVKEIESFDVLINSKKEADITHYHTIDLGHFFHAKTKKSGVKIGYVHFLPETIDGSLKMPKFARRIFDKYIISFYKKMDYLVTVNPYFIEKLENYDIDRKKITSIPNYVSCQTFRSIKEADLERIRKKYKLENSFTVLGVGQVQTRKGVLDFVEQAKQSPEKQFVWAGGFSFGAITDGYKELKEITENPPENVKFLGIIDRSEMNDLYNIADVFFMPSYSELFPMAILEAMSVGKPILLRDLDIYKGILEGFYLPGENESFKQIIDMLEGNTIAYQEAVDMSKKGSAYYSKENIKKMWKTFYEERFSVGLCAGA